MNRVIQFIKKETVLSAAWFLAVISACFVLPDSGYADYIDWRSLGILWSLMMVMQGLKQNGVFDQIGKKLLLLTRKVWQLGTVLVFLCFFCSMLITNDVALITFVPFAILMLKETGHEELMIPIVVLQTIAANLGSMLTPVGNPQNLYLYALSGMGMGEFLRLMLPLTLVSAAGLVIGLVLLKNKGEKIVISDEEAAETPSVMKSLSYGILFVISLLVVLRLIPWYIAAVVVLITTVVLERKLLKVDYGLLITFIGFFIFTGNMGRIREISELLQKLVTGREVFTGAIVSQGISNVPAALLLSGFTTNYSGLILGVNIGGLGTLIASMASLISYKQVCEAYPEQKGRYFKVFTIYNVIGLIVLLAAASVL